MLYIEHMERPKPQKLTLRGNVVLAIRAALKHYNQASEEAWEPIYAHLSLVLDELQGTNRGATDYARIWKWTRPRVYRFLEKHRTPESL